MKRTILGILLAVATVTGYAQTNVVDNSTLWDFATRGSNYWVAPFATYAPVSHDFGYGIAMGYKVTQVVNPVLRLDDFGHQLYVVSGNLELQVPRTLLGKFPITPFVVGGVATPLSGLNSTLVGVVGAGAYFDWSAVAGTNSWLGRHGHSAADYERWLGLPRAQSDQVRIAPIIISF